MNDYIIKYEDGTRILEIGGGNNPLRNQAGIRVTFNIDANDSPSVNKVVDISKFPWPFESNEFGGVFSRYCIEHLEWHNIENFVSEIYRIIKPGSKIVIFTSNTYEQCKKIVNEGINRGTIELLFGSQEFPNYGGAHKCGFSPDYAKELFEKIGFKHVRILPHPKSTTDMIIEAHKFTNESEVFERQYFEDGTIGYKDYRDFATHYSTSTIILKHNPKKLLDVGGGRGYVVKILENSGIDATCMDISRHCFMTRATDNFVLHDATKMPWPFEDKEFDMIFSINFLEHISEDIIDDILRESMRVSNRGLHGIHMTECPFEERDPDIDITHKISKPKEWWEKKFKEINPDYNVMIEHPRVLEYEKPEEQPPISIIPAPPDDLVKLNIGSFIDMFYYGWINIDIIDLKIFAERQAYRFVQHDITRGVPYKDNEVSFIVTNHMLEHITRDEGKKFLQECHRVLKPGGMLRISVPSTLKITSEYIAGAIRDYKYMNVGVEQAHDDAEAYYNLLLAGHKTIYDSDSLCSILKEVGFKNVETTSPFKYRSDKLKRETLTTHPSVSLVIDAEK